MDPYLTIESEGGTLNSNEIAASGSGVEVQPGLTGLGLPPVELQFDQSAGEGARYRGKRFLQRTLDLSFALFAPDREALKTLTDRLDKILYFPCTITWNDPEADEAWTIVGHRSGGGDYAYGTETNGEFEASLDCTFTTESPFWASADPTSQVINNAGSYDLNLANGGNVPSAPVWTVKGPTMGCTFTSPSGEILKIYGYIDNATTLTIDCAEGTVKDSYGINRYNFVGDLPRFWSVPAGSSVAHVDVDAVSPEFVVAVGTPRKNYVTNPNLDTNSAGWTLNGLTYDGTNHRLKQDTTKPSTRPSISTTITGLTVGQNYVATMSAQLDPGTYGLHTRLRHAKVEIKDGTVVKQRTFNAGKIRWTDAPLLEFTAENTSVTLTFYPEAAIHRTTKLFWRSTGWIDRIFVGEPGGYFDGDTADTATTDYGWTGTARASISTAQRLAPPDGVYGTPQVTVSYKPRKGLLI